MTFKEGNGFIPHVFTSVFKSFFMAVACDLDFAFRQLLSLSAPTQAATNGKSFINNRNRNENSGLSVPNHKNIHNYVVYLQSAPWLVGIGLIVRSARS